MSFGPVYYKHIFIYFIQCSYRSFCTLSILILNCIMEVLLIRFINLFPVMFPWIVLTVFALNGQWTWLSIPGDGQALHMCRTCDSGINQKASSWAPCVMQQLTTSHFTLGSVYMSVILSECTPPSPSSPCVHKSLLYVCISIPVLQIGSSVPLRGWDEGR